MYYAQLNDKNICVAISQLYGEVHKENMIQISTYDISILGGKYVNGEWEKVEPELPQEQSLSEQEQIAIDNALNLEYLVCLMETNMV